MNLSSLFGMFLGAAVLYLSLKETTHNLLFFLDMHGILIVCGGTLAATSISFSLVDIFTLVKVFVLRVIGKNRVDYLDIIHQILELNKKYAQGLQDLNDALPTIKNGFLKDAVTLVANGVLSEADLRLVLEQRLKTIEYHYMHDANLFRTIGRFPPAFGLLATTLGMISLLQKIGSPDSQKLIGPAMSIGLIGTLYGIALANLVFIPIAENLTERTHEEMRQRRMILEGVLLMKLQVNPIIIRERLSSFLLAKYQIPKKRGSGAS